MTRPKTKRYEIAVKEGDEFHGHTVVTVEEETIKDGNGLGAEPWGAYHDGTTVIVEDTCEQCGCNRARIRDSFTAVTHQCTACGSSQYENGVIYSDFL